MEAITRPIVNGLLQDSCNIFLCHSSVKVICPLDSVISQILNLSFGYFVAYTVFHGNIVFLDLFTRLR